MIQSGVDLDQLLKAYLKGHNAMFRKAPSEISKMMQTICGLALQSEGYEVCCEQITDNGTIGDQEHMWKFHICALYGPPEDGGLEDLVWLKTPKAIGTLPVLKGYTVFHDMDLTEMEDDVSICTDFTSLI